MYVHAGLIKRQEGDILASLELFQKAVKLNKNNSAAVKQVARSLYVCIAHPLPTHSPTHSLTQSFTISLTSSLAIYSRYLLGRHKAALDTYTEALSLSPQEWVSTSHDRVNKFFNSFSTPL